MELKGTKAPPKESEDVEKLQAESVLQALPTKSSGSRWRIVGRKVIGANTVQKLERRLQESKLIWERDLRVLAMDGEIDIGSGVVHMQFSPSGSLLVVCNKKNSNIYKVGVSPHLIQFGCPVMRSLGEFDTAVSFEA
jgi:hypothetical protein